MGQACSSGGVHERKRGSSSLPSSKRGRTQSPGASTDQYNLPRGRRTAGGGNGASHSLLVREQPLLEQVLVVRVAPRPESDQVGPRPDRPAGLAEEAALGVDEDGSQALFVRQRATKRRSSKRNDRTGARQKKHKNAGKIPVKFRHPGGVAFCELAGLPANCGGEHHEKEPEHPDRRLLALAKIGGRGGEVTTSPRGLVRLLHFKRKYVGCTRNPLLF